LGEYKREAKESPVLYELKQHKPWLDEECLWKQAEMQWLHDPNRSNVDNLNNVKR